MKPRALHKFFIKAWFGFKFLSVLGHFLVKEFKKGIYFTKILNTLVKFLVFSFKLLGVI